MLLRHGIFKFQVYISTDYLFVFIPLQRHAFPMLVNALVAKNLLTIMIAPLSNLATPAVQVPTVILYRTPFAAITSVFVWVVTTKLNTWFHPSLLPNLKRPAFLMGKV